VSHTTSLIIIINVGLHVKTIHFGTGSIRGFFVREGFCSFKTGIPGGLGLGDTGGAAGRQVGPQMELLRRIVSPPTSLNSATPKSDPHVPSFNVTQGHRNRHTHTD